MKRTEDLRRQHKAALALVDSLTMATADLAQGGGDARAVAQLLARLTGLLTLHLAREDRHLYPSLIASPNRTVAAVARRFVAEMGDLGTHYRAFADRWTTPTAIATDPSGFRIESRPILHALVSRIRREDRDLYPLADDPPSGTMARQAARNRTARG